VPRCERRCSSGGEAREELTELTEIVAVAGIHRHVRTMLDEMAMGHDDQEMM
jgi:hypothetical protein